jgi:cell wall-associated NlpC family hydrolase
MNFDYKIGYDGTIPNQIASPISQKILEVPQTLQTGPSVETSTQDYLQALATTSNTLQRNILAMVPSAPARDAYKAALRADFEDRAKPENQSNQLKSQWFADRYRLSGGWNWGPSAREYPAPRIPEGVNAQQWKRDRAIEAAVYWMEKGVPYCKSNDEFRLRGHFPARNCGLDCSNFASWVYNFGLGIQFTSDVDAQINFKRDAAGAGQYIPKGEPLKKGDLVYFKGSVNHVGIYLDENHIIESSSRSGSRFAQGGVRITDTRIDRTFRTTRDNPRYLFARRPIS